MEFDSDASGCSSGDEGLTCRRPANTKVDGRHTTNRWTKEEHTRLLELVLIHGDSGNWAAIAAQMPGRTSKQVRQRYINFTRPGTKRAEWTAEEEDRIALMHATHGPAWSIICKSLDSRTENAVKNHWHATLRSKNLEQRHGSLLAIYIRMIRDGAQPCITTYEEAKLQLAVQMQSGSAWPAPRNLASPQLVQQAQDAKLPATAGNQMLAVRTPVMKREGATRPVAKHDSRASLLKQHTALMRQDSKLSGSIFQNLSLNTPSDSMMAFAEDAAPHATAAATEYSADSNPANVIMHPFARAVTQLQQQQQQQQQQHAVDSTGEHVPMKGAAVVQLQGNTIAADLAPHGLMSGSASSGLTNLAAAYMSDPGSSQSTIMLSQQQLWVNADMLSSLLSTQADAGSRSIALQDMLHQHTYALQPRNSEEQLDALMHSLEQMDTRGALNLNVNIVPQLGMQAAGTGQLARMVSDMQNSVSGSCTDSLMQEVVNARARAAVTGSRSMVPIKVEGGMPATPLGPDYRMMMCKDGNQHMPHLAPASMQHVSNHMGVNSMGSLESLTVPASVHLDGFANNNNGVRLMSGSPQCSSYVAMHGVSPSSTGLPPSGLVRAQYLASPASNVSTPHSAASDLVTVPRSLLMQLGQQQTSQQMSQQQLGQQQLAQQQLSQQQHVVMRQQQHPETAMMLPGLHAPPGSMQQMMPGQGQQQLQLQMRQRDELPSVRLTDWLQKQNRSAMGQMMGASHGAPQTHLLQHMISDTSLLAPHHLQQAHPTTLLSVVAPRAQQLQQLMQAPWGHALRMEMEQCDTPDLRNLLSSSCF